MAVEAVPFAEAMTRKYPECVVLVTTVDENGTSDVMPAGWATVASHQPPMFAISVGHARYTYELIRRQEEFGIAFPGPGLEQAVSYTGSRSGRDGDKFKESGLKPLKARHISPPPLSGCVVNLECRLAGELEAGDHTIFLGRVVAAYVDKDVPARVLNFGEERFARAVPQEG